MKTISTAGAAAVAIFLASAPVYAEVEHHGAHAQAGTFSAGEFEFFRSPVTGKQG
jgi:hypothetical protein